MSLLEDVSLRGLNLLNLQEEMSGVVDGKVVGRHHFAVYAGDVTTFLDPLTGLLVPLNELVYETPVVVNLIVDGGKGAVLESLSGGLGAMPARPSAFGHIGVGTDSTGTAGTQNKLNPSVAGSVLLQACDSGFPSKSGLVNTYRSTFGTGVANFNWAEAGIFNGTTNGTSTMFNRVLIGPFLKSSSVSIVYTTTLTQA